MSQVLGRYYNMLIAAESDKITNQQLLPVGTYLQFIQYH